MAETFGCWRGVLEPTLSVLRASDPEGFDRLVALIKYRATTPYPRFPQGLDATAVPELPADEVDAFKSENIDNTKIKDDTPEYHERTSSEYAVREAQYARWRWACTHFETYCNMLRVSGHPTESVQAMLKGRPLCFPDQKSFSELVAGLQELGPQLETAMGCANLGFVFTGSSVVGFSQNPLKGKYLIPSKITSKTKSDVDICIKADGIERFVDSVRERGRKVRGFGTTCSITTSAMRFGCKDWAAVCPELGAFHEKWSAIFQGGLQFTLCEGGLDVPPWESRIPMK